MKVRLRTETETQRHRDTERERERELGIERCVAGEKPSLKFFPRWLAGLGVRDTSSKVGKRLLDGLTRKVASGHGILNFLSYETRERERDDETE